MPNTANAGHASRTPFIALAVVGAEKAPPVLDESSWAHLVHISTDCGTAATRSPDGTQSGAAAVVLNVPEPTHPDPVARPVGATAYTLLNGRTCRARTDDEWGALVATTAAVAKIEAARGARVVLNLGYESAWQAALNGLTGDADTVAYVDQVLAAARPCDIVLDVHSQVPYAQDVTLGLSRLERFADAAGGRIFVRQRPLFNIAPELDVAAYVAAFTQARSGLPLGLAYAGASTFAQARTAAERAGLSGLLYGAV